jgi:ATP-dependent helicase/nuclease subunit B
MPWPSLYQWLTGKRDDPSYMGWRALAYHNEAAVSRDVAGRLFTNPLHATAGELETFAACPFKHFLQYGLGLEPRQEEDDVSALDMGNVYHHVLERIVAELLKRRQNWADLSDAERDRLIHLAAEQIGQKLRGEILLSSARNRYLLHRIERTLGQVVQTHKAGAARGKMQPAFAKLRFGGGQGVPELTIPTPRGAEVRLSGKIDRVDLHDGSGQAVVVDYRLGEHKLPLADVYHGLALQLLTYLLVLESHGEALAGRKLTPAAAFYVRMLRRLGDVEHPAEALSLDDPLFHLKAKPRGLVAEDVVRTIDTSLTEGTTSDVIQCQLKKDGTFGSKAKSDLASAEEFAALLAHVRRRMGELADEILAGEIGVRPYLLGQSSPCPQCEYRPVCRFQSADGYRFLPAMNREDVLLRVREPREGASGG